MLPSVLISRLDNLASCFVSLEALSAHLSAPDGFAEDHDVSILAFFDHEEVGSGSSVGAGSSLMRDAMHRIHNVLCTSSTSGENNMNNRDELFKAAISRSFVLSIDQVGLGPSLSLRLMRI